MRDVRRHLCATLLAAGVLCARAAPGAPLRLVTDDHPAPSGERIEGEAPGFIDEVVRQVLARMGRTVSLEAFPTRRAWRMVLRGERDGMTATLRTHEAARSCAFPDEPLTTETWILYVRAADAGRLKFSSFEDLAGHDVAVREPPPGSAEYPELSAPLLAFLHEHHNMVETSSAAEVLGMLAAGRVDYAVMGVEFGPRAIADRGLAGRIVPLLPRTVNEQGVYVCFNKARVPPDLVRDFSRALKQYKQTDAFRALARRYAR